MVLKMALSYEFIITRGSTEQGTEVREAQKVKLREVRVLSGFRAVRVLARAVARSIQERETTVSIYYGDSQQFGVAHRSQAGSKFNFEPQLHELCQESKVPSVSILYQERETTFGLNEY